jgi:phenylacetate-CoA ligase
MITEASIGAAGARPSSKPVEGLLCRDGWSRERLLGYQRERLNALLEHAVSSSSYYREVLGADALAPDVRLEELPTLSKATLMDQFDRVLADPRLRLAVLEAHAAGEDPGALMLKLVKSVQDPPAAA